MRCFHLCQRRAMCTAILIHEFCQPNCIQNRTTQESDGRHRLSRSNCGVKGKKKLVDVARYVLPAHNSLTYCQT